MKRLKVRPSLCIACGNCSQACPYSHYHDLDKTRTRIIVLNESDGERGTPIVCLQCEEPACVKVCPTQALVRDEKLGIVAHHAGRCIRCHACVAACPFGNMRVDPVTRAPIKCDLCDGEPLCAVFCPTDAIVYK